MRLRFRPGVMKMAMRCVDGTYIWFSQNHWEIVPISHKQSTTFE